VLRESLLKGKNWLALAALQKKEQFGASAKALARQQLQTMMQSFELLCKLEEQREQQQKQQGVAAGGSNGSSSGNGSLVEKGGAEEAEVLAATVRVVCSRQVGPNLFLFMARVALIRVAKG
jgi:hypothetical protein